VGPEQKHRSLVVGQHHRVWQSRRREQKTQAFAQQMKHRNGIEGTQSELVRAHGIRRARYRGWAKVRLQHYFAAAACNLKRWIRRKVWELAPVQTATALGGAGTRGGRAPLRWLRKPARHKRGGDFGREGASSRILFRHHPWVLLVPYGKNPMQRAQHLRGRAAQALGAARTGTIRCSFSLSPTSTARWPSSVR